jgi:hypothetical protein
MTGSCADERAAVIEECGADIVVAADELRRQATCLSRDREQLDACVVGGVGTALLAENRDGAGVVTLRRQPDGVGGAAAGFLHIDG